jgi:RNA polymerase sigma-70 factor, ECF subfamily
LELGAYEWGFSHFYCLYGFHTCDARSRARRSARVLSFPPSAVKVTQNRPAVALLDQKTNSVMSSSSCDENWRTCFAQLAPKLLLFARQWLPSLSDAQDVVQTAFIRFWRKQPAATPEHYPLLYAAVRTAALDLLRRDGRRARREAELAKESSEGSDAFFQPDFTQRETAAAISAALLRLPEAQREVVVLRIWGELSFEQIAGVLGESINTVASRYRYGLEALRRVLKTPEYERV